MKCPNCHASIWVSTTACPNCSTPLVSPSPNDVPPRDHLEFSLSAALAGVSDRGYHHPQNEDYLALATVETQRASVLVVCDGVSSSQTPHRAARVAATQTCATLVSQLQAGKSDPEQAMKTAVLDALQAISDLPYNQQDALDPPSTTLVAALVQGDLATIGWLGDSRAYWIAAEGSQQLTRDDSWLNDVVAAGHMTEAEARRSGYLHAITRWLGPNAGEDGVPTIIKFQCPSAGYLLLCSDGLWNYVPELDQMANLVQQQPATDALTLTQGLVEYARNRGGQDNITVAVLSLPEP